MIKYCILYLFIVVLFVLECTPNIDKGNIKKKDEGT